MKILMICEFFGEGLDYQENLLAKYYLKLGHQVSIITSTCESVFDFVSDRVDRSSPRCVQKHNGVTVYRLPYQINILNKIRPYRGVWDVLVSERPSVVFMHDISLNIPEILKYKRLIGCKVVMDYHADFSNSGKNFLSRAVLHGVVRRHYLNKIRKELSAIFPVVPASAEFLRKLYGVRDDEMELLPLAPDIDMVMEVRRTLNIKVARQALGIGPGELVIFTGGKFNKLKRTDLLISTFTQLNLENVHLIVAGDAGLGNDHYNNFLQSLAVDNDRVHFVGWQDKVGMLRCMGISDIAVFPASQSVLWQQAVGMGLPLVVGDSGHQDISYLNKYGNIVILRGDDISVAGLGRVIQELLTDPARIAWMRKGALAVSDECLDWNELVLKTLKCVDDIP